MGRTPANALPWLVWLYMVACGSRSNGCSGSNFGTLRRMSSQKIVHEVNCSGCFFYASLLVVASIVLGAVAAGTYNILLGLFGG